MQTKLRNDANARDLSWSRKPIAKDNSDSDWDLGLSLSSMSDLTRFEQFDPYPQQNEVIKVPRPHQSQQLIKQSIETEDWEVIDKKNVPKVPRAKPKINHILNQEQRESQQSWFEWYNQMVKPSPMTGSKQVNDSLKSKSKLELNRIKERKSRFQVDDTFRSSMANVTSELKASTILSSKQSKQSRTNRDSRLNPHRESGLQSNKFKKTPGMTFSIIHPTSSMMMSSEMPNEENVFNDQDYSIVQLSINDIDHGEERSESPRDKMAHEDPFRMRENNHFQTFVEETTPQYGHRDSYKSKNKQGRQDLNEFPVAKKWLKNQEYSKSARASPIEYQIPLQSQMRPKNFLEDQKIEMSDDSSQKMKVQAMSDIRSRSGSGSIEIQEADNTLEQDDYVIRGGHFTSELVSSIRQDSQEDQPSLTDKNLFSYKPPIQYGLESQKESMISQQQDWNRDPVSMSNLQSVVSSEITYERQQSIVTASQDVECNIQLEDESLISGKQSTLFEYNNESFEQFQKDRKIDRSRL